MTAHIIDGKALAATVVADLGRRVATLKESGGPTPGLALIQVGDDAASGGYLRSKRKRAEAIGLLVQDHHVPAETDARTLRALITRLNEDPAIHGILLQLPIPDSLDADALLEAIKPAKDIDGLHPENLGRLAGGGDGLVACTPLGCLRLVQVVRPDLRGLKAVVLGRSRLVGAPIAQLLLRAGASVTRFAFAEHGRGGILPSSRHSGQRRRQSRTGAGRLDQTRRDRHRRGEQRYREWPGRRCGLQRSHLGGRRHHAGPRGRRPDDHRHAAQQRGGSLLPAT